MDLNKRLIANKKAYRPLRKVLRNNSTSAEATLWNLIKGKQLEGKKFRRQHSIENYIVDFYCPSAHLIIELDGDPHGEYSQIQRDKVRDQFFSDNGFKVLRFENRFVFQNPEYVIEVIKKELDRNQQIPI